MTWWQTLLGAVVGILLIYLVLLLLLWRYARKHPESVTMRDALRLLPDLLRMIRRLAADRSVPTGVRLRLILLLVYLASPIDLIPDFIPVLGYADDAIITALVIRSVIRRAGTEPLHRHWPGTPEGLTTIERLAGLPRHPAP
ncbi:MAG: YkvA family protein [Lacisediminihabitans sp.]